MSYNWNKLKEPFSSKDIEWRVSRVGASNGGKPWAFVLAYVTNRAIMDRLDEVFGIAGWKNEFKQAPEGGVLCGISFKHEGEWVTKWDGAENTNIDAVKGGLSSSMKRCGVQLGIGRYLYNLTENFAIITQDRKLGKYQKGKGSDDFYWLPPQLPDWALPENERKNQPKKEIPEPTPTPELMPGTKLWDNAISAYLRDGNLNAVKCRATISEENEKLLIKEAKGE